MKPLEQVIPLLFERDAERTIQTRLVNHDKSSILDKTWHRYRKLPLADIKEALKIELSRREAVQRRALAYLATVAMASAYSLGTASYLRSSSLTPWLWAPVVTGALLYLAGAIKSTLAVVAPDVVYDYFLHLRMRDDAALSECEQADVVLRQIQGTQAQLLVFSYRSERATRCLRNGVLLVAVTMLLIFSDILINCRIF